MFDHTVLRHNGEGGGQMLWTYRHSLFFLFDVVIQHYCVNI